MKVYGLVQVGWEYDDENYYRSDAGGGTPIVAYRSKERAEAEAYRRNMAFLEKRGDYDARAYDVEVVEMAYDDVVEEVPDDFIAEPSLQDIAALQKRADETVAKNAQRAFKAEFAKFFVEFPEITAVRWQQYTPYFNDGEECRFSVGEIMQVQTDAEGLWEEACGAGGFVEVGYGAGVTGWQTKMQDALVNLAGINSSIFKAAFGDHAQIVARKDGTFDVTSYDHE